MRIITINLNGIRSATKKGFFEWLQNEEADVICLQELKAQESDLKTILHLKEYYPYYHFAEKKGYSGVAVLTRHKAKEIIVGLGWETADKEGRYVAVDLGHFWVASLYMPSGTTGPERQSIKFDFLARYEQYLHKLRDKPIIICGDWNIAHREIDLKNWRSNQKNSGFLPEERAWMDKLFNELAYKDAFRMINKESDQYTWWSNRGQAWTKNVGWRIDYQILSPGFKPTVKSAKIYKDQRFSDHAPLIIDYDMI